MSELIEPKSGSLKSNPLFWISLIVIGVILYLFLGTDRGRPFSSVVHNEQSELAGEIDRSLLVPPGMRARQMIEQVRAEAQPFPLASIFEMAEEYQAEGSLADAHLLYFFSAREGFPAAIMKMAEMSDPTLFRADESLLDQADATQSYKWYRKLADRDQALASERIRKLQAWAREASTEGNPQARQLLLLTQS